MASVLEAFAVLKQAFQEGEDYLLFSWHDPAAVILPTALKGILHAAQDMTWGITGTPLFRMDWQQASTGSSFSVVYFQTRAAVFVSIFRGALTDSFARHWNLLVIQHLAMLLSPASLCLEPVELESAWRDFSDTGLLQAFLHGQAVLLKKLVQGNKEEAVEEREAAGRAPILTRPHVSEDTLSRLQVELGLLDAAVNEACITASLSSLTAATAGNHGGKSLGVLSPPRKQAKGASAGGGGEGGRTPRRGSGTLLLADDADDDAVLQCNPTLALSVLLRSGRVLAVRRDGSDSSGSSDSRGMHEEQAEDALLSVVQAVASAQLQASQEKKVEVVAADGVESSRHSIFTLCSVQLPSSRSKGSAPAAAEEQGPVPLHFAPLLAEQGELFAPQSHYQAGKGQQGGWQEEATGAEGGKVSQRAICECTLLLLQMGSTSKGTALPTAAEEGPSSSLQLALLFTPDPAELCKRIQYAVAPSAAGGRRDGPPTGLCSPFSSSFSSRVSSAAASPVKSKADESANEDRSVRMLRQAWLQQASLSAALSAPGDASAGAAFLSSGAVPSVGGPAALQGEMTNALTATALSPGAAGSPFLARSVLLVELDLQGSSDRQGSTGHAASRAASSEEGEEPPALLTAAAAEGQKLLLLASDLLSTL